MVVVDRLFHHKLYNRYIKRTSKFMAHDEQNQCLGNFDLLNNSLWGRVSEEIGKLKELEVLDLGYNNFSGSLPINLGNNLITAETRYFFSLFLYDLTLMSWFSCRIPKRKLLQTNADHHKRKPKLSPSPSPSLHSASPSPSPSPALQSASPSPSPIQSHISLSPSSSPSPLSSSPSKSFVPSPSLVLTPISRPETPLPPLSHPSLPPSPNMIPHNHSKHMYRAMIWSGVGGSFFFVAFALGIFFCQRNKVVMVGSWATGLSGQIRKAFVIGVPKLQRSELVTSCEDFSNIIGSLLDGTVYKGTFCSGVEIVVISTTMKSAEDWSKSLEGQFRKKIATLSRVNHKNFVNLIGFCEEEQPFTRMMVFEYAPNGTFFEHLHSKFHQFHQLLIMLGCKTQVPKQLILMMTMVVVCITGSLGVSALNRVTSGQQAVTLPLPLPMNGQAAIPAALLKQLWCRSLLESPMDPEYDLEIKDDVESECFKYGPILHIHFRAAASQRPGLNVWL
ncbi:protein MALE DISCOVERER 2-like [Impatiens glandulifera]|uniref:protein MALE DISCOVERER 2-like n=1 Tax=Impatiens glandulifera TaxID=253017 RepID=UPI001FB17DB7|nr:protein MALE DISCOVERER 2-like [Impatiens glandulifera]